MDIARAELKKRIAMVMLSTITITHRDPIPWHNALDACFNEVIAATYKPASDCAIAEVLTDISIQLNKGYSDRSTVHLTHSDAQAILEYIGKLEQVNYHTHS